MAAINYRFNLIVRHRRYGDLAGAVSRVAVGKRMQQDRPSVLESLAREGLNLAARWLPRGVNAVEQRARWASREFRSYQRQRQEVAARTPRKARLLWLLPLPLIPATLLALGGGQFETFLANVCAYALFVGGAWLTHRGFKREVDRQVQRFQTTAGLPLKTLGGTSVALATALTAWGGVGHSVPTALAFGIGAFAAFVLLYGLDSRQPASVIEAGQHNTERISAALQQAEQTILTIDQARRRISQAELDQRLERITLLARDILDEIARDPRDFRRARKFLNTYLDGAQRVIAGYARAHGNSRSDKLEDNFRRVLITIEEVFEQQYQRLLQNDLNELDIQMEVLETQLRREGLD